MAVISEVVFEYPHRKLTFYVQTIEGEDQSIGDQDQLRSCYGDNDDGNQS